MMSKDKPKKFVISWDKHIGATTYSTRYTATIDKQELYRGYYLSAQVSEDGTYSVEAEPNGINGHLYPKVLVEKGTSKNLIEAKKKVRAIFVKLTSTYD